MPTIVAIGIGGGGGACLRYLVAVGAVRVLGDAFPWGTWIANVVGALLMGLVVSAMEARGAQPSAWTMGLTTGFLGGFTTYSTFNEETLRMLRAGETRACALYVVGTLLTALLFGVVGRAIGKAAAG